MMFYIGMLNRGINETQRVPRSLAGDEMLHKIYAEVCAVSAQFARFEAQWASQTSAATNAHSQPLSQPDLQANPTPSQPPSQTSAQPPSQTSAQPPSQTSAQPPTEPINQPIDPQASALIEQLSQQPAPQVEIIKPKRRTRRAT